MMHLFVTFSLLLEDIILENLYLSVTVTFRGGCSLVVFGKLLSDLYENKICYNKTFKCNLKIKNNSEND